MIYRVFRCRDGVRTVYAHIGGPGRSSKQTSAITGVPQLEIDQILDTFDNWYLNGRINMPSGENRRSCTIKEGRE